MAEDRRLSDVVDFMVREYRKLDQVIVDEVVDLDLPSDAGELVPPATAADVLMETEFEPVAAKAMRHKMAVSKRSTASASAKAALQCRDTSAARDHLAEALYWHAIVRETGRFGDLSLPDGALEQAARKYGVSATDARVWWAKNQRWAALWMDVGRSMGRSKAGGQKPEVDRMLSNLSLAAEAELSGETVHHFALLRVRTQKQAHALQKSVHDDKRRLQEWIGPIE